MGVAGIGPPAADALLLGAGPTYDECGSPRKHDEPKSITLTTHRERDLISIFSGLRSQCISSREWTYLSAERSCLAIDRTRERVKYGVQADFEMYDDEGCDRGDGATAVMNGRWLWETVLSHLIWLRVVQQSTGLLKRAGYAIPTTMASGQVGRQAAEQDSQVSSTRSQLRLADAKRIIIGRQGSRGQCALPPEVHLLSSLRYLSVSEVEVYFSEARQPQQVRTPC